MATNNRGNKTKDAIVADPRVIQLAESRRRGSIPGRVTNAELRAFGYEVEPDWTYTSAGGRTQAGIKDPTSKAGTAVKLASSAVSTYGLSTIADELLSRSPSGGAAGGDAGTLGNTGLPSVGAQSAEEILGARPGGGSSIWDRVADYAQDHTDDLIGAGGSMLSGGAEQSANNRQSQLDASVFQNDINRRADDDFRNALVQREQEGRASGTDAWKKLQQTEYVAGGGREYTPGAAVGGHSYGFGPKATIDAEKTGAGQLRGEAQTRLQNGNPLPMPEKSKFMLDQNLLRPGAGETAMDWIGTGLSAWDKLSRFMPERR